MSENAGDGTGAPGAAGPGAGVSGADAGAPGAPEPVGPGENAAAGGHTRRRTIGPRGDGGRSRLPEQRAWSQPRMRYRPTEVVSADELESISQAH